MNKKTILLLALNIYSIALHSGDESRKRLCSTAFHEQSWGTQENASKLANTMHKVCAISVKRPYGKVDPEDLAQKNPRERKRIMEPEDQLFSQIRRCIDVLDEQDFVPLLYINGAGRLQTEDGTFQVIKDYKEKLSKVVKQPIFKDDPELHDLLKTLIAIEEIGYKYLSFG